MVDPETGITVPMKDGKPCRVCTDFKTWSKIEKQKSKATTEESAKSSTAAAATTESTSKTANDQPKISEEEWRRKNCPADVESLGNATWTLLHTMAAYYPDRPAPSQMESMKTFISSFSEHYPCWYCKEDFKKAIEKEPVKVGSRKKLSEWLCRRHNEVNAKLGKEQFDCTKVLERWLNGPPDGRCD
ncbi:ERV/ALR sulfhydryl oxidase domain-containing protein [Phascolomyces articulosus]|uniref:Sulfhydryl oxidase n=1 Tax=Phascolomyces articulosus TaxID=60185 RepID=A0AAD5KNN2_9FUNG|nr:ERV/ALR sulfhydryl oxidase domain-containing protein [Phascolomyces articulosus]